MKFKKLGSHSSTIEVLALSDINNSSTNVVVNFIDVMTLKDNTIVKNWIVIILTNQGVSNPKSFSKIA
jgi:hypothetical protein